MGLRIIIRFNTLMLRKCNALLKKCNALLELDFVFIMSNIDKEPHVLFYFISTQIEIVFELGWIQ